MVTKFKCLHSGKCCEKVYTQIDISKQEGHENLVKAIVKLHVLFQGIELEKKCDELKIEFAKDKIKKVIPNEMIKDIDELRRDSDIAPLTKLDQIEECIK